MKAAAVQLAVGVTLEDNLDRAATLIDEAVAQASVKLISCDGVIWIGGLPNNSFQLIFATVQMTRCAAPNAPAEYVPSHFGMSAPQISSMLSGVHSISHLHEA